jgi:hypothetical protein
MRRSGKAGGARGGDFKGRLDKTAAASGEAAGGVTGADPVGPLASILAAQEVGTATDGDSNSRGRARAEMILQRLEELRDGILLGRISRVGLEDIHQMISDGREAVDDPRLGDVLDEIDLRAQVELAKLSVAEQA